MSQSRPLRVHLPTHALDALAVGNSGLSARLSEVALRYRNLVVASRPELTEAQWCAVCDALKGCWLQVDAGGRDPVQDLWMEVADCEGLGEKWHVDQAALAARLREASYPELVAIYEVVRAFWQHPERPTSEALALALQGGSTAERAAAGGPET